MLVFVVWKRTAQKFFLTSCFVLHTKKDILGWTSPLRRKAQYLVVSIAGLNHDALRSTVGPEAGDTKLAQKESNWGVESLWATGERLRSVAGESIESDLPILLLSRTVEVKKRFGVQTGGKKCFITSIHTSKQGVKNTSRFQKGTWVASFFSLTYFHLISLSHPPQSLVAFAGVRCTFKENMREAATGRVQQQFHCAVELDRFYCSAGRAVGRARVRVRASERGEGEGEEVRAQLGGLSSTVCEFFWLVIGPPRKSTLLTLPLITEHFLIQQGRLGGGFWRV